MTEDLGLDGDKLNVAVTVFYGQSLSKGPLSQHHRKLTS